MTRTFNHLSGSTDGQPIVVNTTASGSADTIHTASQAPNKEFVTITAYNTHTDDVTLYLLWGSSGNAIKQVIPKDKGVQIVVSRGYIDNAGVIKAYASVAGKICILGDVEIIS